MGKVGRPGGPVAEVEIRPLIQRLRHQLPSLAAKCAGADLYGSPRLNAFRLFRPNENAISRIVADLFDPRGSHGQGILFLNSLLAQFHLPRVGLAEPVSVRREVPTAERRRIDLVIETGDLLIGIENKPWAGQRDRQLCDYLDALKGWAGSKRPIMVFLSNQEAQTAQDEALVLPFVSEEDRPSLNRVLENVATHIRAPRARMHVEELIDYVRSEFGEEPMIDETDEAFVEAVEAEFERGGENRKAVATVLLAQGRVHARIINEIGAHLLGELQKHRSDYEQEFDQDLAEALAAKHGWWAIRRVAWPANLSVSLGSGRMHFNKVYFGVRAPDPQKPAVREEPGSACRSRKVVEEAVRRISGGSKDAWWPWWGYADPGQWDCASMARLVIESPTGEVKDHPRIAELTERFVGLAVAVDECLEG